MIDPYQDTRPDPILAAVRPAPERPDRPDPNVAALMARVTALEAETLALRQRLAKLEAASGQPRMFYPPQATPAKLTPELWPDPLSYSLRAAMAQAQAEHAEALTKFAEDYNARYAARTPDQVTAQSEAHMSGEDKPAKVHVIRGKDIPDYRAQARYLADAKLIDVEDDGA
jgi:hypothetical protein